MNTARMDYESPRLIAYGALTAITGQVCAVSTQHFDKVGLEIDALTPGNQDLDGTIICDPL